jgi:hypothetical protein
MESVLFTRQRHEADKAGLHYDYRLVVGDKAHSWATKKELPEVGKSIMLWEQPVHTADYALSKKVVIPKGQYGAGVTTLDWVKKGQAHFEDGKIVVHTKDGRFLLKKMPNYEDGTGWLFKQLPKEEKNIEKKAENKYLEKIAGMGASQVIHKATEGIGEGVLPTAKGIVGALKLSTTSKAKRKELVRAAMGNVKNLSKLEQARLDAHTTIRTAFNRAYK